MPDVPNPIMTPAILPGDFDELQDDKPAEAGEDGNEADASAADDLDRHPENAVNELPPGGSRDALKARWLLNFYSPNSR